MTTRLSQQKIKSSDVTYPNLKEELRARYHNNTPGSGYIIPTGGIPKGDLHASIQTILSNVEQSKLISPTGVAKDDLSPSLRQTMDKADNSYEKPAQGIPKTDLAADIQSKLDTYDEFYVFPATGIPRVDLDDNVQAFLKLAETAYQKPSIGIGKSDFTHEVTTTLDDVKNRYKKPQGGIPDTDLKESYAKQDALQVYDTHIQDSSLHITEHDKLQGIGQYDHETIDLLLDRHTNVTNSITEELDGARGDFLSLENRLASLLGLNTIYEVSSEKDWQKGTLTNLTVNKEGLLGLLYQAERPKIELYDLDVDTAFTPQNKLVDLYFESSSRINLGTRPWILTTGRNSNVGIRVAMYVYADVSGIYEFGGQFSGRLRLQVGGQLLFDTQSIYGQVDAYTRTGQVRLEAGRLYPLVLEGWYGTTGDRMIGVTWKKPDSNIHIDIPASHMNTSGHTKTSGTYLSPVIDTKDKDISSWVIEVNATDNRTKEDVICSVRTSTDGQLFENWTVVDVTKEIPVPYERFVQVQLEVHKHFDYYTPVVSGYQIRMIGSRNQTLMTELMEARASFLSLRERLDTLDKQLLDIQQFKELADKSEFHPDFFSSIRLASQELNTLRYLILEAERQQNPVILDNGIADGFDTDEWIDATRSDPYEIVDSKLRTTLHRTRFEEITDWGAWTLNNLTCVNNQLRLATSINHPVAKTITLSNATLASSRTSSTTGPNYQSYIAQPFYTSEDINVLTRLAIYAQDKSGGTTSNAAIAICLTKKDEDVPDVNNPIFYHYIAGGGTTTLLDLRVEVTPNTKYWLVIKSEIENSTGYTKWYARVANTSSHARLRTDNPENKVLSMVYTADANGGIGWQVDTGYVLNFTLDEGLSFVSEGTGERVIDFKEPTNFSGDDINHDLSTDGLIHCSYQSSDDGTTWSTQTTDIQSVPKGRFLRVQLRLQKASTGLGSPVIYYYDIFSRRHKTWVVSKPITAKSIPTHALYYGDCDEGITFYVSRDDGRTKTQLLKDTYTPLKDIASGVLVRYFICFDAEYPLSFVRNVGLSFTTYRDITQQNVTALYEDHVALDGQTMFALRDRYVPGNHSLQVFVNGIRQSVLKDYTEVDDQHVTFTEPLVGGEEPDTVTFVVAAGVYNDHDAISQARIDDIEWQTGELSKPHTKQHAYNTDGQVVETIFNPSYFIQHIGYEYDTNQRKIKETTTTKLYVRVVEYTYDGSGLLTGENVIVNGVEI